MSTARRPLPDADVLIHDLHQKLDVATVHEETVNAVREFYQPYVGPVPEPTGNSDDSGLFGTATEWAIRIAREIARDDLFQIILTRCVDGLIIHCESSGFLFNITNGVLHLYQHNASIEDEERSLTARILGGAMYQDAPRVDRDQYAWWFNNEGAITPNVFLPDEEVGVLFTIWHLRQTLLRDQIWNAHREIFPQRWRWVTEMCDRVSAGYRQ